MKKTLHFKALALLLCLMLILTLIPATASAAAIFTTLEIPVYKTVTAGEGVDPGEATFEFELSDFRADDSGITVVGNTVETDGEGTFQGTIKLAIATESDFYNLTEGFKVTEKNGGEDGWTYDTTEWLVLPYMVEGTTASPAAIRLAYYNLSNDEEPDYQSYITRYRALYFENKYEGETKESDSSELELDIDFVKHVEVEKDGVTAPDKEFNLVMNGVSENVLADLETDGFNIPTTGEGTYKGTIRLIPKNDVVYEGMGNGFMLQEDNDGDEDWEFDDTKYRIIPNYNATGGVDYEVYKEELVEGAVAVELTPVKTIEFTNTYKGDGTTGTNDPGTNEYTISIPLTKVVVQGGDKAAPKTEFAFGISDYNVPQEKLHINLDTIKTNGKGSYEGAVIITPVDEETFEGLSEGFMVFEKSPVDMGDWEYDNTQWYIVPSKDDDGEVTVTCYENTQGGEDTPSNGIKFINTYTAFGGSTTTPPEDPGKNDPDDPGKSGDKVTLTYDANGGFVYDPVEEYEKGTKVELKKTATRDGFTFKGWYTDTEGSTKVAEITLNEDTTVYALWEQTPIPPMLDGSDHTAYVIGYEDGTVRPANNITRAEVTMIFYRLLKDEIREANHSTVNMFEDVPADAWYNEAVSTMAKAGIIKGRSATSFAPNAPITRAEYATICARFDKSVAFGSSDFTDISGHWAESYINRAAILGWVKGYEDKTFRPDNQITRAEAMTLTNRVLQRIPDEIADLISGMRTFTDNSDPTVWYYIPVQEATNGHDYTKKTNGHEKWAALK